MKGTGIQWCDDTVNPTSGCQGCELWIPGKGGPCYAGNFHEQRLAKSLPTLYAPTFEEIRLIPGRMVKQARCMDLTGTDRPDKPWLNGLRRKIFVGDLGDIFSKQISDEYLQREVLEVAASPAGFRHDWLLLTKQTARAANFLNCLDEIPPNVWLGTSVTGPASRSRIAQLKTAFARIRFLSLEPLVADPKLTTGDLEGIEWIIVGGESTQGEYNGRRFDPEWAARIIKLGNEVGAAVFVKQLGSNPVGLELTDRHGGDWDEWPAALKVRRMPAET